MRARTTAGISMTRGVTVAAGAVVVLGVGGCAGRGAPGGSTAGGESGGLGVSVRYESVHEGGEAGGVPQRLSVIAQGDRFRMGLSDAATPDEVYQTMVWDGKDMLLIEGGDASREQDPPAEQRPTSFLLRAGDADFEQLCPGGVRGGSDRVAGRPGTVYTCPAHGTGDAAVESSTITLDDQTGLLLRTVAASSHLEALEVEVGVGVDEGTFSTQIPAAMRGPDDATDDSGKRLPLMATDSVPLASGGELHLADVRHGPSLVVIGELPGVTAMLATLLPRTDRGTSPRVFVLLNPIAFDEGATDSATDFPLATEEGTQKLIDSVSATVRDVPVPVGIDIKGGAAGEDLRSFEQLMAGTTVLAAIDESGALAWRMTDDELARSSQQLDTWIAATS
ncbi:MAG: hypothetical protein ACJ714_14470 [Ornithinibacter sp.]